MNEKHYNPAIAARLRTLVDGRQWSLIPPYLDGLSNSLFRTAGYMLGETLMPQLSDVEFWELASQLIVYKPKAFLVTLLKSWVSSMNIRSLTPIPSFFSTLKGREEDQRKTLQVLLPSLKDPLLIEELMQTMGATSIHFRINTFLRTITPATSFLLLKALHEVEDDRSLLVRTTYYLIKQGDDLSFNLASLLRTYFGLEEVKGTFSLRLQPFELSRLAADYSAFQKAMAL